MSQTDNVNNSNNKFNLPFDVIVTNGKVYKM